MGWNSIAVEVARDHIRIMDSKIRDLHSQLKDLSQQRDHDFNEMQANCDHEFITPHGNWVHEGGQCKYCGINELYAPHQRIAYKDLIKSDDDAEEGEVKKAQQQA